jgi:hypothetical protein
MATMNETAKIALRLDLPHGTYGAYEGQGTRLGRPVELVMAEQLRRFAEVPVDDQVLVIGSALRNTLEETLGTPLSTPDALVKACQRAVEVNLQGVKLQLEPYQLAELKRRAEKNETTLKVEIERAVKEIQGLVFHGSGA